MSIAVESPGLSETQRQIVELARDFARTRIAPFAAVPMTTACVMPFSRSSRSV